ncbi:MAG: hypothetical protein KDC48_01150, partial [Planctomycetes bacterium]|nr:hypothetical protein [Planctomycetota bacterium]
LPPQSVILLAGMLRILGELDASVDLLRRAAGRHSSDFWLSFHTAIALRAQAARSGKKAFPLLLESLSFLRAAVAARPESAEARHLIGQTLEQVGRRDLARDEFAELVRRAPQDGHALTHLGNAIFDFEGPAAALPYLQRAAALSPDDTYCLVNCARALVATGDVWAALPLNRRAWELDPTADHATRYANALGATGDEAGQLAMREQVLAQTPDDYVELYNTATSYSGIGEFERAEGMLRRCIELVGDGLPQAHCNLASTLLKRGRFEAALAAYRDCHRLGSAKPGWQDPSAEWVARAERAVAFARALGDADDAAAAQALEPSVERAEFAAFLGRHALATRWNESLYAALAPAQWPREHVDLAARAAVRTAAAATDPGAADHAAQLALAWLGTLQDLLMADFRARPRDEAGPVRSWLGAWHQHADLAWLRDIDALPEALREQVRGFWARLDRDLAEIVTAMQR